LFLKDLLALEGLLGIFDVLEDLKEGYAISHRMGYTSLRLDLIP
jgi:hypothetical protein